MKHIEDFVITIFDKKMLVKLKDYRIEGGVIQLIGNIEEIVEIPKEAPELKLKDIPYPDEVYRKGCKCEENDNSLCVPEICTKECYGASGYHNPINTYPDYMDDAQINKDIELETQT